MINYGLRNNLPSNTLYNSQIGAIIFCYVTVIKLSALPGLISEGLHSSTVWFYMIMAVFDVISLSLIYVFARYNGDAFLVEIKSKAYRILAVLVMLFLGLKSVVFFSLTSLFLTKELFITASPFICLVIFIVPVIYLGIKGARTIARTAEIFLIPLFIGLMINLIFLKTETDFGRNLPILAMDADDFFKTGFKYGFWLCDFLPFMFIKIQNKRMPYIGISTVFTYSLVLITITIGVAMYGDALEFVSNFLVKLAGFNQLTLEIGRMEWIALSAVVIMGTLNMSYQFFGIISCCERVFKTKKPAQILFPTALIAALAFAPSIQQVADIALTPLGYVFFALSVALPLTAFIALAVNASKHKDAFDKYKPKKRRGDTVPDTSAINEEGKKPAVLSPSPLEDGGKTQDA